MQPTFVAASAALMSPTAQAVLSRPPPSATSLDPLRSASSPPSGSSLDPLRVAGSALSTLIAQATAAAQDHERALAATSEAAVGWQQRATAAEAEVQHAIAAHRSLQVDRDTLSARVAALEQAQAASALHEREFEARHLEVEAQLAGRNSELRTAQQAHALVVQQKLAAEEEVSRILARSHASSEAHVHEQEQLRSRLEADREAMAESSREANARLRGEIEAMRAELTRRLQSEQETVAKLREEIREARLESERLNDLRIRERTEAETAAQHALELQRASIARMESKMAACVCTHRSCFAPDVPALLPCSSLTLPSRAFRPFMPRTVHRVRQPSSSSVRARNWPMSVRPRRRL